jgi:hypothetical protein
VRDAAGEITDVAVSYPMDFMAQMLEYSGKAGAAGSAFNG